MIFLIFASAVILAYGLGVVPSLHTQKELSKKMIYGVFLSGMLLKMILAAVSRGYESDFNCFSVWADMVFHGGFSAFYRSEAFTDYPPGYMYILWMIGFFKNILPASEPLLRVLIKLPAILADLFSALLIFRLGGKKRPSFFLAACYLLNPAVVLNSSLWGQVDSVLTFTLFLSVVLLLQKKPTAYLVFAVAVLLKPQALILTPVMLYGYYQSAVLKKNFKKHTGFGFCALLLLVLLSLPFGFSEVLLQYQNTLSSYPYFSVNAFNLWAALGQNWVDLTPAGKLFGYLFIVLITILSFFLLSRRKAKSNFFFVGGFLYFSVYLLSVKMHDRYAFPAILFFLGAYLMSGKRRFYRLYAAVSASQFFNGAYTLLFYQADPNKYYHTPAVLFASVLNLLLFLYVILTAFYPAAPIRKKTVTLQKSKKNPKLLRADWISMAVMTLLYAAIAFSNLGNRYAPQTGAVITSENPAEITLSSPQKISSVHIFPGEKPSDKGNLQLTLSGENGETKTVSAEDLSVFCWEGISIDEDFLVQSIELSVLDEDVPIREIGVFSEGNRLSISSVPSELTDEQNLVVSQRTYQNSTYFDEIYHARTAYEFIHRLPVYEWTHPPLGKFFISLGIRAFGMNPFGWRFAGVLFGILMIPVFYLFSKAILNKTWRCTLCTLWFAFDFMHYVQTRISTIDCFVTFFILLQTYFMYQYCTKSFYDLPFKKNLKPLFWCGVATGCSVACKWQGVYATAGLGVLFFLAMHQRYAEYRQNPELPFFQKFFRTAGACVGFFIVIPALIYALAYLPYLAANHEGILGIFKNQTDMFTYHSKTVVSSTHSYSSPWFSWPLMLRPIWYYSQSFADGTKGGISAFGNPAVWWLGIPASIYCIYLAIWKKDKAAAFLLIAYAAQYVPWIAVERTTFIYHYFPSVPFIVLMIGLSAKRLCIKKRTLLVYTAAVLLLFCAFYPVLTGIPVNPAYVYHFLKWLPGWVLI